MAEASWPDPADGRVVSEAQYEQLACRFAEDGINGPFFDQAIVTAGSGMKVNIEAGWYANVRGFAWYSGESDFEVGIDSNDNTAGPRTDWVVLRLDRSDWTVRVAVRKGTPASGPPSIVQQTGSTGVYEIPLATVTVPVGANAITDDMVTWLPLYIGSRIRPSGGGIGRNPNPQPGEITWTGSAYEGWTGTKWQTVWQDLTAQANLTPTVNWRAAGTCKVDRTRYGLVEITLNLIRQNDPFFGATSDGSRLTTVPSIYRPVGWTRWGHAHVTPDNQVRIRVETDGTVWADNPTKTVETGRALRFTFVYAP